MKTYKFAVPALFALLLCIGGSAALSADAPKKASPMDTPEMRQKMADMHQKMAECLRSDKPMSECKQEMMKNCPMKGMEGCPWKAVP